MLRVPRCELDRDGSASVTPVGGGVRDAECRERFGECVGKVLNARLRYRQLVRETEARRVEGKASETLPENRQQWLHHLGGARRRVQHGKRWPVACAQIMHPAVSDSYEVFREIHQ